METGLIITKGEQVGALLKERRVKSNLTQLALAKKTGTGQRNLSNLENCRYGSPSVKTLILFARALHCDLVIDIVPKNRIVRKREAAQAANGKGARISPSGDDSTEG